MKKIRYPGETMMRYFTAAFLTGVLFSFLIIWCGRSYYLQKAGLISDFYLRRLKYRSWEKREFLGCFLGKRMKWVAFFSCLLFGGWSPSSVVFCRRLAWFFFWYDPGDFRVEIRLSGSWNRIAPCIASGDFLRGRNARYVSGAGRVEMEF